jgi:hypothetical protein
MILAFTVLSAHLLFVTKTQTPHRAVADRLLWKVPGAGSRIMGWVVNTHCASVSGAALLALSSVLVYRVLA